jgi:hypothetical protein
MKPSFPVTGLREFIQHNQFKALRSFCETSHPAAVGELLSIPPAHDVWEALSHVTATLRAQIFSRPPTRKGGPCAHPLSGNHKGCPYPSTFERLPLQSVRQNNSVREHHTPPRQNLG